jgi:hypothetical protein
VKTTTRFRVMVALSLNSRKLYRAPASFRAGAGRYRRDEKPLSCKQSPFPYRVKSCRPDGRRFPGTHTHTGLLNLQPRFLPGPTAASVQFLGTVKAIFPALAEEKLANTLFGHLPHRTRARQQRAGVEGIVDDVVALLNPRTGKVENIGVLFLSTRLFRHML